MNYPSYVQMIGRQLRARRALLGLNQHDVALLAGTSQRTVSQVENGKAGRIEMYAAIAEAVGLRLVAIDQRQVDTVGDHDVRPGEGDA